MPDFPPPPPNFANSPILRAPGVMPPVVGTRFSPGPRSVSGCREVLGVAAAGHGERDAARGAAGAAALRRRQRPCRREDGLFGALGCGGCAGCGAWREDGPGIDGSMR